MSRLLDVLGEFDRAAGPSGMETRVMNVVRKQGIAGGGDGADDVAETEATLGALARNDRAAASASLEDRIYMATRAILVHHANQLHEEREAVPSYRFGSTLMRCAAGLLLGGSVIWGYLAINPGESLKVKSAPTVATIADQSLEQRLDQQLDDLGNVFALAMVGSESETVGTGSLGTETDALEDWFQFDFVQGSDSL